MHRADWPAIAEEYITGEISMRSLALKYAVPRSTLRSRAYREDWIGRRAAFRGGCTPEGGPSAGAAAAHEETAHDGSSGGDRAAALEKTAYGKKAYEKELFRVTDKLVRRAEELLDSPEGVGVRELGELMRAIKNAKEIRMLRSELDELEQRARLRTLEEKSAAGADRTLRIEFAPETEEAAQ